MTATPARPNLPEASRQQVVGLVRAVGGEGKTKMASYKGPLDQPHESRRKLQGAPNSTLSEIR